MYIIYIEVYSILFFPAIEGEGVSNDVETSSQTTSTDDINHKL